MGIHVIPGTGTGKSSTVITQEEADAMDLLKWRISEATMLAGPVPQVPPLLMEQGFPAHHVDPKTGWIVWDGEAKTTGDPNANAMATAYTAEIAAWNEHFRYILDLIREKSK